MNCLDFILTFWLANHYSFRMNQTDRKALSEKIRALAGVEVEDHLIRTAEVGIGHALKDSREELEGIKKVLCALNSMDLSSYPSMLVNDLEHIVSSVEQLFGELSQYQPLGSAQEIEGAKAELHSKVLSHHKDLFSISRLFLLDSDHLDRLRGEAVSITTTLAGKLKEVDDVLKSIQKAALEVGVSQHAIHFNQQAKLHEVSGSKWLRATIVLALFAVSFAGYLFWRGPLPSSDIPTAIHEATGSLIVFSMLVSAAVWAGRIYRSHRHNYIVNIHRQNSLSTFEAFVKSTSDQATRDAVLLQATQCIFSQQKSGYDSREGDPVGQQGILGLLTLVTSKDGRSGPS